MQIPSRQDYSLNRDSWPREVFAVFTLVCFLLLLEALLVVRRHFITTTVINLESITASLFFVTYEATKRLMSATLDNGQYVPLVHMVAASCGETVKYH
jgi:hypothetical protein